MCNSICPPVQVHFQTAHLPPRKSLTFFLETGRTTKWPKQFSAIFFHICVVNFPDSRVSPPPSAPRKVVIDQFSKRKGDWFLEKRKLPPCWGCSNRSLWEIGDRFFWCLTGVLKKWLIGTELSPLPETISYYNGVGPRGGGGIRPALPKNTMPHNGGLLG